LGNGQQWMSWIHIDDYCAILLKLLHETNLQGAYNLTSPQPARNAEFSRALAAILQRPLLFSMPAFALKFSLGERSSLLLGGQRVLPSRMMEIGFEFAYAELEDALHALLIRR